MSDKVVVYRSRGEEFIDSLIWDRPVTSAVVLLAVLVLLAAWAVWRSR